MNIKNSLKYSIKLFFITFSIVLSVSLSPYANADGGGTYSVYDTDRDGFMDRVEFEKFADSKRKRSSDPGIWVFDNVDVDNDSKISEQEMVDALIKDMQNKKKKK
ncbi:MAG: hypothetical protein OQL06_12870 [Gammaproteobacteria bacterium]|nr:hypothetical protein [Gammaproteobacteria bacterium]